VILICVLRKAVLLGVNLFGQGTSVQLQRINLRQDTGRVKNGDIMAKRVSWLYGGKRYYGTLIRETKTHKFARTKSGKIKRIKKKRG
jgi:hypothetical protein